MDVDEIFLNGSVYYLLGCQILTFNLNFEVCGTYKSHTILLVQRGEWDIALHPKLIKNIVKVKKELQI